MALKSKGLKKDLKAFKTQFCLFFPKDYKKSQKTKIQLREK